MSSLSIWPIEKPTLKSPNLSPRRSPSPLLLPSASRRSPCTTSSRTPTPTLPRPLPAVTPPRAVRRASADGPEDRVTALASFDGEVHKGGDIAAPLGAAAASEGGVREEDARASFDGDDAPAATPAWWRLHSIDGSGGGRSGGVASGWKKMIGIDSGSGGGSGVSGGMSGGVQRPLEQAAVYAGAGGGRAVVHDNPSESSSSGADGVGLAAALALLASTSLTDGTGTSTTTITSKLKRRSSFDD